MFFFTIFSVHLTELLLIPRTYICWSQYTHERSDARQPSVKTIRLRVQCTAKVNQNNIHTFIHISTHLYFACRWMCSYSLKSHFYCKFYFLHSFDVFVGGRGCWCNRRVAITIGSCQRALLELHTDRYICICVCMCLFVHYSSWQQAPVTDVPAAATSAIAAIFSISFSDMQPIGLQINEKYNNNNKINNFIKLAVLLEFQWEGIKIFSSKIKLTEVPKIWSRIYY